MERLSPQEKRELQAHIAAFDTIPIEPKPSGRIVRYRNSLFFRCENIFVQRKCTFFLREYYFTTKNFPMNI